MLFAQIMIFFIAAINGYDWYFLFIFQSKNSHLPRTVKGKYGAWYLDINLWKYRPCSEVHEQEILTRLGMM